MQMYESNFATALAVAIVESRKAEALYGYTRDSIFVAGLVEVLDALNRGEHVEIIQGN